ncbi:hypothetical protein SNE35_07815 [Paucibacter sp. R3-3]|uniref:Uncharacterized protein n=1 Tax=Roseateles agri TaxID=3098619 RepID=A0ABU5DF61_9BURK|nr:hypothetical protein [Paucibacter sp. R3-3]MDY0744408.1 hypothetical protein [Paucibacter sp. R3-3]
MTDKYLSELEWKKFAKGKGLKDAALIKAFAALESAKAPAQQLEALAEIEKQADILRKADKSNKELQTWLGSLDKDLDKQRKLSQFEAKKAEATAEEEDSPAALTTQMVPLLRQVAKGGEFPVVLASTGAKVAVLVAKRSIAPSRRKLLTDYLGVTGGVKFIAGHCLFEQNAHTFVLATQAAGMAKKIKAALLEQTNLRFKVRVRGEDPADIDDDGDEPGAEHEGEETAPDEQGHFNKRLATPIAAFKEATAKGLAAAPALKLKLAEAGALAQKKQFDAANAQLDEAEALLKSPSTPRSLVQMQASRLAWDSLRKNVQAQLQKLEASVLEAVRKHNADESAEDEYDETGVATSVKSLYAMLDTLDTRLIDKLDEALNAEGAERDRLNAEAAGIAREYQAFVDSDPLIQEIDANGFVPTNIRAELQRTLGQLHAQL